MKYTKLFLLIAMVFLPFGQAFNQMTILSGPEKG
jgi:hypothetical protein